MARYLPLELTELKYTELVINFDSPLGQGAYGEVYRAKADQLPCAAKYFSCDGIAEGDIVRVEQELQLMTAVKHPNLVQCLGTAWDCNKERPMLLTELLEESLSQFLNRQTNYMHLPYYLRVNICHDVALAVSYLHKNGLIHGDLTSTNILLVGESRAKVTDYWMLRLYEVLNEKMQHFTHFQDKLVYMAPEVQIDPRNISPMSDSFSFAVCVVEVDSQKLSSPAGQRDDKYSDKMVMNLPKNSPFMPLVQKCLQKEAESRPPFEDICLYLGMLKDDPMYAESIQHSRAERTVLQQQFSKNMSSMEMKIHEITGEMIKKEKRIINDRSMVGHLLTKIDALEQQLQSQHFIQTKVLDGLDEPDYKLNTQDSGIIEYKDVELASEELGQDEKGEVFRGTWNAKNIAFKKLTNHQSKPEKWQRRLQLEIMVLHRLSHPNIVQLHGVTMTTGKIGIIMELMQISLYHTLFSSEKSINLTKGKKKIIVRQIACGIEYLHSNDIVHCNLSSANILLSEQGIAKVTNYGPKCTRKNSVSSYHMVGDIAECFIYSAPEVLRKDILLVRELKMADTYSLAMVAYEVLTENHPFRESISEKELTTEVVLYNFRPSLDEIQLPHADKEILKKCWDADPISRLSAGEFVSYWNRMK